MKSVWKGILTGIVVMAAGFASAQSFIPFNPPPCDFSDRFYNQNGMSTAEEDQFLQGRFGPDANNLPVRQFGAPATQANQANWVTDTNCTVNSSPIERRNVRILATTGAFRDSDGAPTEFFSLIAFMNDAGAFLQSYTDQEGDNPIGIAPNSAGIGAEILPAGNGRGYAIQNGIINNFVAYAAVTQKMANGALAPTPCGSLNNPNIEAGDCFNIDTLPASVCNNGTPAVPCFAINTLNLRQDWRLTSNRNAIDGSDNNCIDEQDQNCKNVNLGINDSPFGYFCDDLLGTWLIHYWWYTENAIGGFDKNGDPINPTVTCNKILSCAASVNGTSLDGTPIIKTGAQLNFLEGVTGTPASVFPNQTCLVNTDLPNPSSGACAADSALTADSDGTDATSGATWIICPDLPDPRNGAIASDAFLDAVRLPGGAFQSTDISNNFTCLQQTGKLCSESAPEQ